MSKDIHITRISEGDEKTDQKKIFKAVMAENFLKSITNTKLQIWKTQRTQHKINTKQKETNKNKKHLGVLYYNFRKPKTKRKF